MTSRLKEISSLAHALSVGNYDVSVIAKGSDDELGIAIGAMTDILKRNAQKNQDEAYFADGVAQFNDSLSGIADIAELLQKSITMTCRYVGASKGAIYTFDKEKAELTLAATFAFDEEDKRSDGFKLGEGVIGQVALEKKPISLIESASKIQSATATFEQKEVYAFALTYEEEILGVAEIMSLKEFTKIDKDYFDKVSTIFAVALHTAQQNARIKELFEKSQQAFEELQVQSEEIQETNVEMQEQQQQLTMQSKELKEKNYNLVKAKEEIDQRAHDLEKASKYKSEFLANMSHELRTPLNSIILLSKLLSMNSDKKLDEDDVKKVSVINRAGNDLLLLINDILDLTKIESGKMELSVSELHSVDVIEEMRGLFGALSEEKKLDFIVHDNFNDRFETDQTKLAQVLKNLLSNAFKFTKNGSVTLDIDSTQSELIIKVIDSGIGIQRDKLEHIFEAFKQGDGSISREFGGTGLGLSISKTIVELLNGRLIVESEFGKGTTFLVALPFLGTEIPLLAKDVTPVNSVVETVLDDDSALNADELANKNILIVDDDSRNIFTLTAVLENMKAEVYSAFNGKEAMEYLEGQRIDLILMDIMMPVMDGLNAIKAIKANEKFKDIPIIAITAKTMPQDKQDCLDAGANDYLAKPLDHSALISMVKAWVK